MWNILNTGKKSGLENMKADEALLKSLKPSDQPILHLYDWEGPSATYGYFIDPKDYLKDKKELHLARRPTGGGILFHIWDLSFSVLVPSEHPGYSEDVMKNYHFINDAVLEAVKSFLKNETAVHLLPINPVALDKYCEHFCFAKPTKYDVMIGGKKVAGAAQRRKRNGFLHQGSISIVMPEFDFLETILPDDARVIEAMKIHTFSLLPPKATEKDLQDARKELSLHLQKTISSL